MINLDESIKKRTDIPDKSSYGTAIQVFGRCFAGAMDMKMKRRYKLVEDFANEPFKIRGVSPFSIVGTADPMLQKYANCECTNTRVKADIRKNFDEICVKAYADWFVIDNSAAIIGLWKINGQFYSLMGGEKTDFMDDFFNNDDNAKRNYIHPESEGFSERLRKQYDLFIDIILRHYDARRIILVKSSVSPFICIDGKIELNKDGRYLAKRAFLQEIDEYFVKHTGCYVISLTERFWRNADTRQGLQFVDDFRIVLEDEVARLIENPELRITYSQTQNVKGLRSDITMQGQDFVMLDGLRNYWGNKKTNILADYIADGGIDLSFVADYFKCIEYSFDDIIALFYLYNKTVDKTLFKEILKEILGYNNGVAYRFTQDLFNKNIKLLNEYDYNFIDCTEIKFKDTVVVRIADRQYIRIKENGEFEKFDTLLKGKWDYKQFIMKNYTCGIDEIEDALSSWETYFERGRRRCIDPFVMSFANIQEFIDSLYFLNYEDILLNENYVIALPDSKFELSNYKPKVDVSFWFDEKVRVKNLVNGLADQIYHYRYMKSFCDKYGLKAYFDDLQYDKTQEHIPLLIKCFIKKNMNGVFFSEIFSPKLRQRLRELKGGTGFPVMNSPKYFALGLYEQHLIVRTPPVLFNTAITKDIHCPLTVVYENDDLEKYMLSSVFSVPYIATNNPFSAGFKNFKNFKVKFDSEDYFAFPEIVTSDSLNYETSNDMQTSDSIAIHIRRGDYMTNHLMNAPTTVGFYKNAIRFILYSEEFSKYKNKKLFVFSDDIPFCKEHKDEIGISLFDKDATYVDWNHHFNNFRDMHLISLAKIIIRSIGGFARAGALMSKSVEHVINVNEKHCSIEYQREDYCNVSADFLQKMICIRSYTTGKYIANPETHKASLYASADNGIVFKVNKANDGWYCLQSTENDRFLSVLYNQKDLPVQVRHTNSVGSWEQFKLYKYENGYAIKSSTNNCYLQVKNDELYLSSVLSIDKSGLFDIEIVK